MAKEYRVLAHWDPDRPVHLAEYGKARSLCGRVFSDGPHDEWQTVDETCGPEGCGHHCDHEDRRCQHCWVSFDAAKHRDRDTHGKPTLSRTYTRKQKRSQHATILPMAPRKETALQVSQELEAEWQELEARREDLLRKRIAAHRQSVKAGATKAELSRATGLRWETVRYLVDDKRATTVKSRQR